MHQTRLRVSPDARVYEIGSPADWHVLAVRCGDPDTYLGPDRHLLTVAGIDHGPAPTWSRVAADWDGVHLSFAGLLSALYVPVTTDDVTTTLWSWEWEKTLWLQAPFTSGSTLRDLPEPPENPVPHPDW